MRSDSAGCLYQRFACLMPYDLYERHRAVITLLHGLPVLGVLDVGGRAGLLSRFAGYDVTALNVDWSGDVKYDGCAIPFPDGQFSAVVSIDTLEHLPKEGRRLFLSECLRVAERYLVIAAPFGSPGHIAYEERLNALFRQIHGRTHVYLNEHVRYGLPTEAELKELLASLGPVQHRLYFSGDYARQGKHFERVWLGRRPHGVRHRFQRFIGHISSLGLFHPVHIREQPYALANRFYLLLEKSNRV